MDNFPWTASWDTTLDESPRIRSAKFGDGYEQRSPDGINPIDKTFRLTFGKRTEAEVVAIRSFLVAKRGVDSFLFRSPVLDGEKAAYVAKTWTSRAVEYNNFELTVNFERDYGTFVNACSDPTISVSGGGLATVTTTQSGGVSYYAVTHSGQDANNPYPERDGVYVYTAPVQLVSGDTIRVLTAKDELLDSAIISATF